MTFKATIQASGLQELVQTAGALVDECRIHVEDNGLRITAVDPANVGMVDESLDQAAFSAFDAQDGSILGVNLARLRDIVGMADSDDDVTLETVNEKLEVRHSGLDYTLALIDPSSIREEPDIPNLELPVSARITKAAFDRGITAADMVSDHVEIGSEDGELYFRASGDTDDVDYQVDGDDYLGGTIPEDLKSKFSLDYLKDMKTGIPSKELTINLGDEFPTHIEFEFANGNGTGLYMLAPRISSE